MGNKNKKRKKVKSSAAPSKDSDSKAGSESSGSDCEAIEPTDHVDSKDVFPKSELSTGFNTRGIVLAIAVLFLAWLIVLGWIASRA